MNPDELPLLGLFNRLREHGLQLGIEEYMAVLRALRAGFGVGDRRSLEQLCCTAWVKSEGEARLFHRLFEQMLAQPVARPHEPPLPETPQSPLIEALQHFGERILRTFHSMLERLRLSSGPVEDTVSSLVPPKISPSFTLETDEPGAVVQAIRRSARGDLEIGSPRFSLLTEYFPVTRRQMKQSWRHLRRPVREGPLEELDVRATIDKIGREGILLEPVMVPRRSNRAELVLLIDQDGSMVPFHALSRQLAETARRGGRLGQAGVYYFHDYPDGYLYRDPARLEAQPVPDALAAIGERAAVLIVSDAGAARGNFDPERLEQTRAFVQQLKQSVRRYAWLNPMPNDRWSGTTAGEIACLVPMFEMSRRGLDAAISALQGRYVYWEKTYSWMM
jgi:uncharacterized protein with von Willebrand factor type A (vWA) domain